MQIFKMKTFILILSVILLAAACKKDDIIDPPIVNPVVVHDTIKPKAYLPVYPGSWWKYQINDTTFITLSTSSTYILHSYQAFSASYDPPVYTDSVYVPFNNSEPIYGYDKIEYIDFPFGNYNKKWPVISELIGFEFDREWTDPRYGDFNEKVQVSEKVFDGQDSILVLTGHWIYGLNVSHKSFQEYKKGIGLSKHIIVDTLNNDTLFKKILIDYYINDSL